MTINNQELHQLISTIKTLRGENGCPWDIRQTSKTLVKHLKSECNELIEAIEKEDHENICEESGDLLYLILMLTEINSEQSRYQLKDVICEVNSKLIRRHPHVFQGTPYENEEQLKEQWLKIKSQEKNK